MNTSRRAFTFIELISICVVSVVIVAILLPATHQTRICSRQIKDGTQVRSIHQAFVSFGVQTDEYPLPSRMDCEGTIPSGRFSTPEGKATNEEKDLPRFVLSLLIFNGSIGPEICVSPSEVNPLIKARNDFQFKNPSAVAFEKRQWAILDPSFACYPDEQGGDPVIGGAGVPAIGGCSYAFSPFYGARRDSWASTFDAYEVVLGNRGPWYKLGASGDWVLDPTDKRGTNATPATASNTLLIHGARNSWEGNVARNDNSVAFEIRPDPENLQIEYGAAFSKSGIPQFDNIFANEDEGGNGNAYSRADDRITPENIDKRKNNYLRCWGGDGSGSNLTFDRATGRMNSIIDFWYD